jgi:hypothetical protein
VLTETVLALVPGIGRSLTEPRTLGRGQAVSAQGLLPLVSFSICDVASVLVLRFARFSLMVSADFFDSELCADLSVIAASW